jgi:predicted DNA binding CopG/RHH family protein
MSRKTFKNEINPALQFISNSTDEENQSQVIKNIPTPVPMKRNPLYIETKSRRIQLLMQPSLHDKLKNIAAQKGTSLNDLIHTLLEKATQKSK